MSVDRSKRLNKMFAPPKTLDLPTGDTPTLTNETIKDKDTKETTELIDLTKDIIIKTEDVLKKIDPNSENILIDPLAEPPETKNTVKSKNTPPDPKNEIKEPEKFTETPKSKEVINCRASLKMKGALEDMAKDFAYLARKKYGIKIKDDTSPLIRAFLLLGMSCFTENIQHQILQEFDTETPLQQEITKKLIALMKIQNVEMEDIDIRILNL